MPPAKTRTRVADDAFEAVFVQLRALLKAYAPEATVTTDVPGDYQIASPTLLDRVGRPLAVAAVQTKKNYVSFHLIPVYAIPELAKTISPALRKRMQGKSCFNFTVIEPVHLEELAALTRKGVARIERIALPWARTAR